MFLMDLWSALPFLLRARAWRIADISAHQAHVLMQRMSLGWKFPEPVLWSEAELGWKGGQLGCWPGLQPIWALKTTLMKTERVKNVNFPEFLLGSIF